MLLKLVFFITEKSYDIDDIIKIGSFTISVLTLFGALIGGIHSFRKIALDRKNKQLSDFILLFSDKEEIKRLSGIHGLSSYSKFLFRELFFICSIEKDAIIKELIFTELQKQSPHSQKHCIQINDFIVNYFIQNSYQSNCFDYIKMNSEVIRTLKNSQTNRRIQFEINQKNSFGRFEKDFAIDNHLLLSSRLLASAAKHLFFVKLCGNLVIQSNMYASKWKCSFIQNCVFIKNVSRHSVIDLTKFHCCCIVENNFYDSKFMAAYFNNCLINKCSFINSNIRMTSFKSGKIQEVRFDKSALIICHFICIKNIYKSFWNGCKILNCKFEQIQMTRNEIKGSVFFATRFLDVKFFSTHFVSDFRKCQFTNVKWGGSKLSGVRFINCIMENVDFAGANLKNCKFINCKFSNTNFEKMHSASSSFVDCNGAIPEADI